MTSQLRRVDLLVRVGPPQESWVAAQMLRKQVDAAAMDRQGGRIRQFEPVLHKQLEDLMLARWIAAISLKHEIDRRQSFAIRITDPRAELKHERRPGCAQRFGRAQ